MPQTRVLFERHPLEQAARLGSDPELYMPVYLHAPDECAKLVIERRIDLIRKHAPSVTGALVACIHAQARVDASCTALVATQKKLMPEFDTLYLAPALLNEAATQIAYHTAVWSPLAVEMTTLWRTGRCSTPSTVLCQIVYLEMVHTGACQPALLPENIANNGTWHLLTLRAFLRCCMTVRGLAGPCVRRFGEPAALVRQVDEEQTVPPVFTKLGMVDSSGAIGCPLLVMCQHVTGGGMLVGFDVFAAVCIQRGTARASTMWQLTAGPSTDCVSFCVCFHCLDPNPGIEIQPCLQTRCDQCKKRDLVHFSGSTHRIVRRHLTDTSKKDMKCGIDLRPIRTSGSVVELDSGVIICGTHAEQMPWLLQTTRPQAAIGMIRHVRLRATKH